jgi:hypothetical protein
MRSGTDDEAQHHRVDRLILANGPSNVVASFLEENGLREVAEWESDPICIVRDDVDEKGGEVVWIDYEAYPDLSARPLAPDFETFLIMAGRLFQAMQGEFQFKRSTDTRH